MTRPLRRGAADPLPRRPQHARLAEPVHMRRALRSGELQARAAATDPGQLGQRFERGLRALLDGATAG